MPARRTAGSTTPCLVAIATPRRRPPGRCSSRSSRPCSIPATTGRGECRATNATPPAIMISPRTCGWSKQRFQESNMARDFEDHCWKDVIDADTIQIYQAYRRRIYVGDNPAVLAIDLYNKAYRGGD